MFDSSGRARARCDKLSLDKHRFVWYIIVVKDEKDQLPPPPEVIHVRGWLAEDDEWYTGHDTITAPDGKEYPIKDRD